MSAFERTAELRRRVEALPPAQQAALAARLGVAPASGAASPPARLVAWIEVRAGATLDDEELRAYLRSRLPEALVPSQFVRLAALPRLPNGKVDAAALPAPELVRGERAPAADGFVAPRSPAERTLAAIWAEVLGASRISVFDNFFELGGDSLLSIQVVAKARRAGLVVAPDQLFRHGTLAELAAHVGFVAGTEAPPAAPSPPEPAARAAADDDVRAPAAARALTPTQNSLLFATLRAGVERDPAFLHLRCTLRGELEDTAFEEAWRRVIARHDALRASVHWTGVERPIQLVHARAEPSWVVEDWRALAPSAQERELTAFLQRDRTLGLDLTRSPVLRLARFRTGEREWRLVCSCHHVLLDGWSGELVVREAVEIHDALRRGDVPRLGRAHQFGEYVDWLQRQDPGRAGAFWRRTLTGLREPTPLPLDRARAGEPAGIGALDEAAVELDAGATAALEVFARRERLTTGTVLQGAWALVLSGAAQRPDVCYGVTVSGRAAPLPGIEATAGLFTNALPVRVSVARDARLSDFLRELQARTAELRAWEHIAPAQIQAWSEVAGHSRVFDSLLVVQRSAAAGPRTATLRIEELSGGMTTSYPLTLVMRTGARLSLRLIYDTARFDRAAVRAILDQAATLLGRIPVRGEAPVSTLLSSARLSSGPRRATPIARRPAPGPAPVRARAEPPGRARLERQLIQIWENVLDVHPIGPGDDFFALGGHSLSAARLFEQIERVFGRRLPLATLFQASTIERLAARLDDEGWTPPWSSLVAIQPEGSGTPLFCVHSYEGNVLVYRSLARRLAPDQPVYGLQSVGLDGSAQPLASVEEMASHYLDELRTVQPTGPYALAGICFGISVAFEMAQRLHAEGEEVSRLIILDSGFLTMVPLPGEEARDPLARLMHRARGRVTWARNRSRRLLERSLESELERRERRLRDANERAFRAYSPAPYPGRITLIRTAEYGVTQEWHDRTWSALAAGGLDTFIVAGGHSEMLREPNVAAVAERIRACLAAPQSA